MSNGYDQFFKKARQASQTAPAKKAVVRPRASLAPVPKNKKSKSSVKAILLSMIGFVVTATAVLNFDELERSLSKVDISFGSKANAESAEKKETSSKETSREPAQVVAVAGSGAAEAVPASAVSALPIDESHLAKLVERSQALDAKEEELRRMEAEIAKQKIDLEKKIADLEAARNQISSELGEKVKVDESRIDTLVQLYTNMKPPQASKVIETIDEDLAIEVLSRMKKKSAADIMNLMKPEKAQMLSEKYAGYKKK